MPNFHTEIQEIIEQKNIRKLVHFTKISNLKSIIEYGILSRKDIEKKNIKFDYNDDKRLDTWIDASCVSVTKKNSRIFPKFLEKTNTNENDWIDIFISPNILTEKECIFCFTNAANHQFDNFRENKLPLKSPEAFRMMFNKKIKRKDGHIISRDIHKDNETTCIQAEICVFGIIEKKYFLNLNDIMDILKKNG